MNDKPMVSSEVVLDMQTRITELQQKLDTANYKLGQIGTEYRHLQDVLKTSNRIREEFRLRLAELRRFTFDREILGQKVRQVWIMWAAKQPNPKPSWLLPWEQLSEVDREVDRQIGEILYGLGMAFVIDRLPK